MKYLSANVSVIFIMLGDNCNLQCKYCMQHDIRNEDKVKEINKDIYLFIKEKVDAQDGIIDIRFYGGEPLLYYDKIVEIVNNLKGTNCTYSIITNGKLLTEEKINWLNENDIRVAISWDGNSSIKTRGYDVVINKGDLLYKIKNLGFNSVISALNYPLDFITSAREFSKKYMEINHIPIFPNIDSLLDFGEINESLLNIDFDRVSNDMEILCKEFEEDYLLGDTEYKRRDAAFQLIYYIMSNMFPNDNNHRMKCRNGSEVLNLDLTGNLYLCHNTREKLGTIYDEYYDYIKNVIELDKTNLYNCKYCEIVDMCGGGCPLVPNKDKYYCDLKRAIYYPVVKMTDRLLKANEAR